MTPDAIGKLISELNTRISSLVNSANIHEKAGAISAIGNRTRYSILIFYRGTDFY
jgi:hypothetical protein